MWFFSLVLFISLCGWIHVSAELDLRKHLEKCKTQVQLSPEEEASLSAKNLDSPNAKCLVACIFKELSILDAEGKISSSGLMQTTQVIFPGDSAQLEKTQKYAQACLKVNDVAVGDGSAGCERAALLIQCISEYRAE